MDVWKVWHDKGNMVCKGKIVITKKYFVCTLSWHKNNKNDQAPVHNSAKQIQNLVQNLTIDPQCWVTDYGFLVCLVKILLLG